MNLFELMTTWRKQYEDNGPSDRYRDEYVFGVKQCAAELEDWLRTHEPIEYERYRQQREAEEQ